MIPTFRAVFLRLTALLSLMGGILVGGYSAIAIYFLATGGLERVRQEFSGQIAAARRATGEQPPDTAAFIWILGISIGLIAGGWAWSALAQRAGVGRSEILSVFRSPLGFDRRSTKA
jgi:hypothetical protein